MMRKVVFCTFTKSHGMNPGLIKHGFIDLHYFRQIKIIPETCVYVDISQRSLRFFHRDGRVEDFELDYWGFSGNIFHMCKDMTELEFPFECHCVVNSVFGEYE